MTSPGSHDQKLHGIELHIHTSSGTALMLVKPFLNIIYTFFAPHRRADVAQSNAVSPTPKTITFPYTLGNLLLHAHIPK